MLQHSLRSVALSQYREVSLSIQLEIEVIEIHFVQGKVVVSPSNALCLMIDFESHASIEFIFGALRLQRSPKILWP